MEDIGDWIYVIIIIIAAISSIISSVRKKTRQASEQTQQTQQAPQTQPREIFRGDTFDDDFWGPEKPVTTVIQPSKTKQPQTTQKQNIFNLRSAKEGQRLIEHINMDSSFTDDEEQLASITIEDLPSNTEDWRKAFIYNEIFNRKY